MKISLVLNGKNVEAQIPDGRLLIDFLRDHGCLSVKRGCESSNCGLCTVFMDDKPVLPVLSWRPGPTATGSIPWRGSRRRLRSSERSSPTREQSSAASAIRAWS